MTNEEIDLKTSAELRNIMYRIQQKLIERNNEGTIICYRVRYNAVNHNYKQLEDAKIYLLSVLDDAIAQNDTCAIEPFEIPLADHRMLADSWTN